MLGEIDGLEVKPSPNRGMTPRIFEFLFARIQAVISMPYHLAFLLCISYKYILIHTPITKQPVRFYSLSHFYSSSLSLQEEESRKDERLKYNCKCSFLEIYNEQITDLLDPSSTNLLVSLVLFPVNLLWIILRLILSMSFLCL